MMLAGWLIIFAMAFWFFNSKIERDINPNTTAVLAQQSGDEVRLERNREGHYVADGAINGFEVRFMIDTGATSVALSESLGKKLQLRSTGRVQVSTANGATLGHSTRLASVKVGSIELENISAVMSHSMPDDMVLLGMSFLKHLDWSQKDGQLVFKLPQAQAR